MRRAARPRPPAAGRASLGAGPHRSSCLDRRVHARRRRRAFAPVRRAAARPAAVGGCAGASVQMMMQQLLIVGIGTASATDVAVPADWVAGVASSNLLFAPVPTPSKLLPSIENGFIGGDVGCTGGAGGSAGALHLAGLYSGGSHTDSRSGLPNPLAAELSTDLPYGGAALDVSAGIYLERWPLPVGCGAEAVLESRRYAHRQHRSLLVWELRAINATASCNVSWRGCAKGPSGMLQRAPGVYEVVDPEQPADPTFPRRAAAVVAIASNMPQEMPDTFGGGDHHEPPHKQWNLTVGPTTSKTFLAVVRTTLEPGVTNSTVMDLAITELAQHTNTGATTLGASHQRAWADAYGLLQSDGNSGSGGGIELVGNPQLSAYVNSSLYYLLCSIREDWPMGISEGGIGSEAYRGMMFWSDGVMDGPLFAAINAPIADALLQYRTKRLNAAKSIARMNGYAGAYWPWQSGVTGFERSCGNLSIAMKSNMNAKKRVGCYWMHEIHISADVALYFRLNYYRSGQNETFLKKVAWPIVSATADFFASRVNRSTHPSGNWTMLQVIGPDEHSYITDSNTYTNAAAGYVMGFAAEAANILGLDPPSLADWMAKSDSMYVPVQEYCLSWQNASTAGCPADQLTVIHPQYDGYHGQDINQADVALLQWPLHMPMDAAIAKNDLRYYAARSSGSDTKGFYTGDSSYAIAMLFAGERAAAETQLMFAFDHQLPPYNIWTETNPRVAARNSTGNLNFLTGAGGFLENIVFGYGGIHYSADGLALHLSLPPMNVTSMTLRGVAYAQGTVRLEVNETHQMLSRTSGCTLKIKVEAVGAAMSLATWPSVTVLPLQQVVLQK